MSEEDTQDSSEKVLFSSEHGWIEADRIQRVVSSFQNEGLIFLPSGTWEESLIVTQHNLTIIGNGDSTVITNTDGQPPISIIAPQVRIYNLSVEAKHNVPAISLTHGDATQTILNQVRIKGSESHGVYRDEGYGFTLGAISNCIFNNIQGHGIYAPSGTGPRNLIYGNVGEEIDGDFIRWGCDRSILLTNHCLDAPIRLTEDAHMNFVLPSEETALSPGWPDDNIIVEHG